VDRAKTRRFFSPFRFCAVVAITVTTTVSGTAQNTPPIRLLPTGRDAARIRVLAASLADHKTDDVQASSAELGRLIQDFVTRQLDAAPTISDVVLSNQLLKVLGRDATDEPDGVYVRSGGCGPRSKQCVWAVAYVIPEGAGAQGVIECYFWEPGRARLAGRQDADFFEFDLHVDWLASGPLQVALLGNGRASTSNGLGAWKAAVYVCDQAGVHTIWESPTLHGLTAVARDQLIALRHAQPMERGASSAASWTYEVYVFTPWPFERPTVTLVSRETRDR
jgi:hypothetical protein